MNVTVFAYGATGAGKTYTMFGDESAGPNQVCPDVTKRLYIHI